MSQKKSSKARAEIEEINKQTEKAVGHVLGFFFLNRDRMKSTKIKISENSRVGSNYILLLIFSALVIMSGMIIDSAAVVIGGMIISPLFWPVLGFSFGVVDGNAKMVLNSFLVLFKSLLIVTGIAVVVGIFAPLHILEAQEFVSRTTPTIYDLFIGILAGFLGAYIVAHPKISSSFGGVVVAAALVPPIVVMGIALSKGEFVAFGGAFLLTIASLVSMTFAASILFYIGRINARKHHTFFNARNIAWYIFTLAIVIFPLFLITNQVVLQAKQEKIISLIASSAFPHATLIEASVANEAEMVSVKIIIHREEEITDAEVNEISSTISKELKKTVVLSIKTVPTFEKKRVIQYD